MASIRGLRRKAEAVTVRYREFTVALEYYPHLYDDALAESMLVAGPGYPARLNAMLLKMVRAWDLKLDDGDAEPAPLAEETLAEMPVPLKNALAMAIIRDAQDPNASTTSPPGSTASANGVGVPITTPTSAAPDMWAVPPG